MKSLFGAIIGKSSGVYTVDGREVSSVKSIGEGGNAEIFLVKATKGKGEKFALKRMSVNRSDKEKQLIAQWEFQLNQALPEHPNLVKCEGAQINHQPNGDIEYLLLLEYCSDGTLLEWLQSKEQRTIKDLLTVFSEVLAAVAVFHSHQPPIAHRDLKPENVLRNKKGDWKLCDFGSATTDTYMCRTSGDRVTVQAILDKNTTPSYRAPEMCDLYRPMPINHQADIWALGVMLYQLLFREQPFPDGSLGIVSGKYHVPESHKWPKEVMDLLARMLTIDPSKRATIVEVQIAVGEIIKTNPRLADPWTLPFTSASLAASASLVGGRSKSPGLTSPNLTVNGHTALNENSRSRSASKQGDREPLTPAPADDATEPKKKKDKVKKKKAPNGLQKFTDGDFDAVFPANNEAQSPGATSEPDAGFIAAGGIQWESEEHKDATPVRPVSTAAKADDNDEDVVQEPSGNRADRPRAASMSQGDTSSTEGQPEALSIATAAEPAKARIALALAPPPPTAVTGRAGRKERSGLTSPPSAVSPPVSSPTLAPSTPVTDSEGKEKEKKKKKKDKADGKEGQEVKEKKKTKKNKGVSGAAAAASESPADFGAPSNFGDSAGFASSGELVSPTSAGFDESGGFGASSSDAWGAEPCDEEAEDDEQPALPTASAGKPPPIPARRPSASSIAAKLRGALSSASSALGGSREDSHSRNRSKSRKNESEDDDFEESEELSSASLVGSEVAVTHAVSMHGANLATGTLSPQAAITERPRPPSISTAPPLPPLPTVAQLPKPPKSPKLSRAERKVVIAPLSPAPVTNSHAPAPAPPPSATRKDSFGAVDLDDPFGDKDYIAEEQHAAASVTLASSQSFTTAAKSTFGWPMTVAVTPPGPVLATAGLASPSINERPRGGSNASVLSTHSPSLGAQSVSALSVPGTRSRASSVDDFDPLAVLGAGPSKTAVHQEPGADRKEASESVWGSEPAGWDEPSQPRRGAHSVVSAGLNARPLPLMPQFDPRSNDFLQFRYVNQQSEQAEFLLQPPRAWLLADKTLPVQDIDDCVGKATKKDNGLPRAKYGRQLILSSWAHDSDADGSPAGDGSDRVTAQGWTGLPTLFQSLQTRPVLKYSQVAFKSLLLLHRLMQFGSPAVLGQMFVSRQFLLSLQSSWTAQEEQLVGVAPSTTSPVHDLIVPYSKFLLRRIYFIYQYRQFEGNFSLGFYLAKLETHEGWPGQWTLPLTTTRDQSLALIQVIHEALTFAALVFEPNQSAMDDEAKELRQASIVPLADDLYGMWMAATFLLNQLCLYTGTTCFTPYDDSDDDESSVPSNDGQPGMNGRVRGASNNGSVASTASASDGGDEESTVSQSLTAVIAHHRSITDRLNSFFATVNPLPSYSAQRRAPNLPGRVNPFQPTPEMHFPPPSLIPRIGLQNAQLVWTFQAQCSAIGTGKRRVISVDEDLAKYQAMIVAQQRQQQREQTVRAKPAESTPGEASDEDDDEEDNGDNPFATPQTSPQGVAPPISVIAPSRQTTNTSTASHSHRRVSSDNPFGDDDDDESMNPVVDFFAGVGSAARTQLLPQTMAVTASSTGRTQSQPQATVAATLSVQTSRVPAGAPGLGSPSPVSTSVSSAMLTQPFSDEIDPSDLNVTGSLGKNEVAEVWSGSYQSHTDVAIKTFAPSVYESDETVFRAELEIVRKLRHPHLVLFMGATTLAHPLTVVSELMHTNLFDLLHSSVTQLPWYQWLQIALDTAKGLAFLHAAKPAPLPHRGLQSSNVLLDANHRAKVCDFGFTHAQRASLPFIYQRHYGWQWRAPEQLQSEDPSTVTEKADVYSFGIILFEIVTRSVPYADLSHEPQRIAAAILQRQYRPALPAHCPVDFAALVQACWSVLPSARPTIPQCIEALAAMAKQAKSGQ